MTNSRHREDRRYPRADFNADVILQCTGQEYVLTAHNISARGMGLDPNPELAPETEGTVRIPLRPGQVPLACRCRVVYSIEGRGIGIEFLELSEESQLVLNSFVRASN